MQGFEWDTSKSAANDAKHGVTFDEAASCFDDPGALVRPDDAHSDTEDRLLLVGLSRMSRLLSVVYTMRGESIRLISARRATPREARHYGEDNDDSY